MFSLWKPLIPPAWKRRGPPCSKQKSAGEIVKKTWYFNREFQWLGMAICAPVIGLWTWCTDQYIVQRALGAPDERRARQGSIFAAVLKLFPVYFFIVPGLICYALAKGGKVPGLEGGHVSTGRQGHYRGGQAGAADGPGTFSRPGLRGIVVAVLLSALMGSLAGVFNACSTLLPWTFMKSGRPKAMSATARPHRPDRDRSHGAHRHGLDSRHSEGRPGLFEYLPADPGYLAPPIFVVFFFGVFFEATQRRGMPLGPVFAVGFVLGVLPDAGRYAGDLGVLGRVSSLA